MIWGRRYGYNSIPAGAFIKGIIKAVAGVVLVIVGALTGNVQLMIRK